MPPINSAKSRCANWPLDRSLPAAIPIAVSNGEWVLSVAPDAGWHTLADLLIDGALVLLIALLGGLASYLALRQVRLLNRQAGRPSAS